MNRDYDNAVKYLADNSLNSEFSNKGPEHASVVLENLLKTAEKEVVFFSGIFDGSVVDKPNYVKAQRKFLETGKPFYLFLEKIPNEEQQSAALKELLRLKDLPGKNVYVETAPQELLQKVASLFRDKKPHHFAVADSKAYRMETDPAEYTAICNFNDPKVSKVLRDTVRDYIEELDD